MKHNFKELNPATLPYGCSFCKAAISDDASHINMCYNDICALVSVLRKIAARPVFSAELWLAVKDDTGIIIATGITEPDQEISKGVPEWIQVL